MIERSFGTRGSRDIEQAQFYASRSVAPFGSGRDDDQTTRARAVSATPASSDAASATIKTRRSKGSPLGSDATSMTVCRN